MGVSWDSARDNGCLELTTEPTYLENIDPKLIQCWPTVHDSCTTSKQNGIKISCYLGYIKNREMKHNFSDAGPAPSMAREPAPEQRRRTIYNCPTTAQNQPLSLKPTQHRATKRHLLTGQPRNHDRAHAVTMTKRLKRSILTSPAMIVLGVLLFNFCKMCSSSL